NGIKPTRVTKTGAKKKTAGETLSQPADLVVFSGAGEEIRTLDVHLGKSLGAVLHRSQPFQVRGIREPAFPGDPPRSSEVVLQVVLRRRGAPPGRVEVWRSGSPARQRPFP